jgi:hypothetical protein
MRPRKGAHVSKIGTLLGRLEEQAIRIHELTQERERECEAARQGSRDLRFKNQLLREEVARLSQPRDPDGKKAHAYDELHRVILDAHSLVDRPDLTDADKAKSIHGLLDQVMARDWFADSPHKLGASPKPRRAPRKPKAADEDAQWAAADADALASPADEHDRDYYTRKEVEREPETEEDAREFAREFARDW